MINGASHLLNTMHFDVPSINSAEEEFYGNFIFHHGAFSQAVTFYATKIQIYVAQNLSNFLREKVVSEL